MHYRPMGCAGLIGHHHNNRRGIELTRESIGKKRGKRLSKTSVDRRRYDGAVSEIQWAFLGVVSGFTGFLVGAIEWRIRIIAGIAVWQRGYVVGYVLCEGWHFF